MHKIPSFADPELRVLHLNTAPLPTSSSSKVYRSYRPSGCYACQCLGCLDSVLAGARFLQWREFTVSSHSHSRLISHTAHNTHPCVSGSSIVGPSSAMKVLEAALLLATGTNAASLLGPRGALENSQIIARQSSSSSRYPAHTIDQLVRASRPPKELRYRLTIGRSITFQTALAMNHTPAPPSSSATSSTAPTISPADLSFSTSAARQVANPAFPTSRLALSKS